MYVETCMTNDEGERHKKKCVFPFDYKGTTYYSCTDVGHFKTDSKPWCPTKVDSLGENIGGEWGYCGEGCVTGNSCQIFQ